MTVLTLHRWFKQSIPLIRIDMSSLQAFSTLDKSKVLYDGHLYSPEPAIDVKLPKQGISIDEEPCIVTLPTQRLLNPENIPIVEILSQARSTPAVRIQVKVIKKASQDQQILEHLYDGVLDKSRRNPSGNKGVIELEFLPDWQFRLEDISLGRRCDPTCDVIFGKTGCRVDTSQYFTSPGPWFKLVRRATVTATFASYRNSRNVTLAIDAASMPGVGQDAIYNQPKDWWVRSYLEADSVRIPVQEWTQGTSDFILNRIPPLSWETPGKKLTLVPGCPKTPQACADRNNSERFGGLGFGIPAYNPTLEVRDA